jgi:hypothetical protein
VSGILAPHAGSLLVTEEATVQDLKLAQALGFERPTNIRNLIKRHRPTLEAMGLVLQSEAPIRSGKGRVSMVTEFRLNPAQAAFIIAKAGTKRADSLAVLMAEVFAMFSAGKLVAADEDAAEELAAAQAREARRRYEEERDARSEAFAFLR